MATLKVWKWIGWLTLFGLTVYFLGRPALGPLIGGDESGPWPSVDGRDPIAMEWSLLASWQEGDPPHNVLAMDGQLVRIPGFIVPLDGELDRSRNLLLVPYLGACTHLPPPPENQMIVVRTKKPVRLDLWSWEPIWMVGFLSVGWVDSTFGEAAYSMQGITTKPWSTDPSVQLHQEM